MSNMIYKISYGIDNYGNKSYHAIKINKYKGFEKDKCIIIESERRRIHKDKLDVITAVDGNDTRGIRFYVWTLDESKIEEYKVSLKECIVETINNYKNNISKLEKILGENATVQVKNDYDE